MIIKIELFLLILFQYLQMAMGAIPGTFFWKPRLGLDLSIPTTEFSMRVLVPNKENIEAGLVVLFDGYEVGLTIICLIAGATAGPTYPHLSPTSAFFYTNVYRWTLRYLSNIPFWLGGSGGHFCDTHKVWKRRFYYMNEFLPKWLRKTLFYVDKNEWELEERDYKRFQKYAEPAFGKFFRYPNKNNFRNFTSQISVETYELLQFDSSSSSSG